jgi:hypothetical protein
MTELSPQAQEVFWAFNRAASGKPDDWHYLPAIAAALEAVADQVVPKEWPTIEDYNEYEQGVAAAHIKCRNQLLAIAAELRGDTTTNEDN